MTETTTFPATPEEFEEYKSVMNAMAEEAEASTPDPKPEGKYFEGWSPWVGFFKVKL